MTAPGSHSYGCFDRPLHEPSSYREEHESLVEHSRRDTSSQKQLDQTVEWPATATACPCVPLDTANSYPKESGHVRRHFRGCCPLACRGDTALGPKTIPAPEWSPDRRSTNRPSYPQRPDRIAGSSTGHSQWPFFLHPPRTRTRRADCRQPFPRDWLLYVSVDTGCSPLRVLCSPLPRQAMNVPPWAAPPQRALNHSRIHYPPTPGKETLVMNSNRT